jgi:hypothetical protein
MVHNLAIGERSHSLGLHLLTSLHTPLSGVNDVNQSEPAGGRGARADV